MERTRRASIAIFLWVLTSLMMATAAPTPASALSRSLNSPLLYAMHVHDDDGDDDDDDDDDDGGDGQGAGAVFAMTNDAANNQVAAFRRAGDGRLTPAGTFSTGGQGSGTFENSANGLLLGGETQTSPSDLGGGTRFLLATNAGSDSISVFRVRGARLTLVDVEPSNGDHPISVTLHSDIVYVLNGGVSNCMGGTPTITGFRLSSRGNLTPIPGSTQPVIGGAGSGCAQVSFDQRGEVLIVTERVADIIDTYRVDDDGRAGPPMANPTTGVGPFGFTLTRRNHLLTTENFGAAPLQGGAASYDVEEDGTLTPNGPTERNGRSDTCWFEITDNQRFGYVTNFQSGDISSYRVSSSGRLRLLNPIAAVIGVGASDEAIVGSRFLYVRNAVQGTISVFRIRRDGSLRRVQDVLGLPPGGAAIGIAAK